MSQPNLNLLTSEADALAKQPYLQGNGWYTDGDDVMRAELKNGQYDLQIWLDADVDAVRDNDWPVYTFQSPL